MTRYTQDSASVLIYTFKEGLLSKVAHDLKLQVESLEIEIDGDKLNATIDTKSIQVVCARKHGADDLSMLSDADRGKILESMRTRVLKCERYPEIRFTATIKERSEAKATLESTLELCGVKRDMVLIAKKSAQGWGIRVRLHQPDFGIKPFRAALGALKVQPDVEIEANLRLV